jgi:hypothetical protein
VQKKRAKSENAEAIDRAQLRAFHIAAREAGCDDNEERFTDALRTIARAKPKPAKALRQSGSMAQQGRRRSSANNVRRSSRRGPSDGRHIALQDHRLADPSDVFAEYRDQAA